MPLPTQYRKNTRKLTGVAKYLTLKQKRRNSAFNAHRRSRMMAAPAPKKLTRKQVQAISMNVDQQLRKSARLATRVAGSAATAAEKKKAAEVVKQSEKAAVKSATAQTIKYLYPSLLKRGPPGVLKSKVDSAWKQLIQKRRVNGGVLEYRAPPRIDPSLNALTASLARTFGNASTRFMGPPRHHLVPANRRALAAIRENNENE